MAKFTFSFLRSEYERIPQTFKKELSEITEKSGASPETKALVEEVGVSLQKAIEDICRYVKDQLEMK